MKDGVMAGHVEYDVVMIGEDVDGSGIDKRIGLMFDILDMMIHMMRGTN